MAAQKAPRRKAFAIKADEGQPLSRRDIQFDFLSHIFDNDDKVFTDPTLSPPAKATFRDVYVHALIQSPRTAKALREKMQESPDFASDFAKVALLANVGRINTTMTFLPEMRTSLRQYHPVPSLQKVDPNLQDAPRIKNILKACHLPDESDPIPVTPAELRSKIAEGASPSTSIVNLLFVLSNHFTYLAHEHFNRQDIDFLDFFMPVHFSSSSRARAFLWLAFRYYEGSTPNPFDDVPVTGDGEEQNTIPRLVTLSPVEFEGENTDTDDEKAYGKKMCKFRLDFLSKNAQEQVQDDTAQAEGGATAKNRGKGKGKKTTASNTLKRARAETESNFDPDEGEDVRPGQRRRTEYTPSRLGGAGTATSPRSRRPRYNAAEIRRRMGPQRTVFAQALQEVTVLDPLADSDDEADDGSRFSYGIRLHVLDNLSYVFKNPRISLFP